MQVHHLPHSGILVKRRWHCFHCSTLILPWAPDGPYTKKWQESSNVFSGSWSNIYWPWSLWCSCSHDFCILSFLFSSTHVKPNLGLRDFILAHYCAPIFLPLVKCYLFLDSGASNLLCLRSRNSKNSRCQEPRQGKELALSGCGDAGKQWSEEM